MGILAFNGGNKITGLGAVMKEGTVGVFEEGCGGGAWGSCET